MNNRPGRNRQYMMAMAAIVFLPLPACTHPIETRVDNSGGGAATGFTMAPASTSAVIEQQAEAEIRKQLLAAGYSESASGPLFVQVDLADRPSDIALSTGKGASTQLLSAAQRGNHQRLFPPCGKRDYRLSALITRMTTGEMAYSGSASERHCTLNVTETLPFLAEAALADLGGPARAAVLQRAR